MHFLRVLLLIAISSSCTAGALHAQGYATGRGSLIVGGTAGLTTFRDQEPSVRNYSLHFSPRFQYFVSPGLGLGASVGLFHMRQGEDSSSSWGLGPEISYFFGEGERTLLPYVSALGSFSGGEVNLGGAAGAIYMLTSSVGLDTSLFYRHQITGAAVGITAFVF